MRVVAEVALLGLLHRPTSPRTRDERAHAHEVPFRVRGRVEGVDVLPLGPAGVLADAPRLGPLKSVGVVLGVLCNADWHHLVRWDFLSRAKNVDHLPVAPASVAAPG